MMMEIRQLRRQAIWLLTVCIFIAGCSGDSYFPDAGPEDGYQTDGDLDPDIDGGVFEDDEADSDLEPIVLSIHGVLPSRGPIEGGSWANIVGSGFVYGIGDSPFDVRDVTYITFGDNSAIDIEIIRDDMISVRTPAGSPGPASVTVENPNGIFTLENAFYYYETVTVEKIDPVDFSSRGGTIFEVLGTGFSSDTRVLVGGIPASSPKVDGSTKITALAPPGTSGPTDLEIINQNGRVFLYRAATYHLVPVLASLQPTTGSTQGGLQVVAQGEDFTPNMILLFDDQPALEVTLIDDSQLQAVTPSGSAGPVDLTLSNPAASSILPGGFFYLGEPSGTFHVAGIVPSFGPPQGGNLATIIGEGFSTGIKQILIGGQEATIVQEIDDRHLEVEVPPNNPGVASIEVQSLLEYAIAKDVYLYIEPLEITSIEPGSDSTAGGTSFTIQGSGFHSQVEVLFGGVLAEDIQVISATELAGTIPAGIPGKVDIIVLDNYSQDILYDNFNYTSDLALWRVEPNSGAIAGGTYVTCYGQGFNQDTKIWFGQEEGIVIQVLSPFSLIARTPQGNPGEVNVKVSNSLDFELKAGFSYFDPTNDRGGASGGPIDGSINVTILNGSWLEYGTPIAEANVLIDEPAVSGSTDERGQITFSGPSFIRPVTITMAKEGFMATTISNINAANITVYLYPNESAPIETQPGGEIVISQISGRVFGFKDLPSLPSGPDVSLQARVMPTSYSIYSVPPYGGYPQGPVIENDGGQYFFTVRPGNYSIYSIFGAYDAETDVFTPALLGIRRSIQVTGSEPVGGQDIILGTHLDQTVSVHLIDPPIGYGGMESEFSVHASLDLGADGIIYLADDISSSTDLLLSGLPAADGSSFIFVSVASLGNGYPMSYTIRRQAGGLSSGVNMGPFLGYTEIIEPEFDEESQKAELIDGRISWAIHGETPALTQVVIQTNELFSVVLWRILLPGHITEITLPEELLSLLPQGEPLIAFINTANSPRFNFDSFNYSQLGTSRWTSYTVNFTTITVP
jgi:hypothetical protein